MLKIKDLQVGESVTIDLVVKSAEIKFTKAKKPFLMATFFDGSADISGNDWDWGERPTPPKNAIVTVIGEVTEYLGKKQLKIAKILRNASLTIDDFAPKGNMDVMSYASKAKELIEEIQHHDIRELLRRVFNDNSSLWSTVPGAKGVHHAYLAGTLQHSVDTALKAKAIAELTSNVSVDLCVAGALLHDLGKLWTYKMEGVVIDVTFDGTVNDHIVLGALKLQEYEDDNNASIIKLLRHIILSHHGKLEYGSPVTPAFMEAIIVNFADELDAKLQIAIEANAKVSESATYTDKVWALENRQLVTQSVVASLLMGDDTES